MPRGEFFKKNPDAARKQGLASRGRKNPGAGRDPDWLKQKCQEIVIKHKLMDWLGRVAAGEKEDRWIDATGKVHWIPCNPKDRLRALEMLQDRGWGLPKQTLDVGVSMTEAIVGEVRSRYQTDGAKNE